MRYGIQPMFVAALLLTAAGAAAQEAPPKGPAEIIQRASKANNQPRIPQPEAPPAQPEGLPPGHAPVGTGAAPNAGAPVGDDPHANAEGAPALARRPIATAEPSASVPVGAIRVRVVDLNERPVADAQLQLGTMAQDATRSSTPGRTGADGTYVFDKLAHGDKQAYRVNVLHQGAKFSSNPFRLPADRGYDVLIRQLETTTDPRDIVLYVGASSIELKDERLKVVQQARLVNIGGKAYVFPEEGQLVRLPADLLAFQTEEVMTDQRLTEVKGEGMRIKGSLPPGEVTLTWGFDVPQSDTTAEFKFDMPWLTFAYRVLADAAPGMTLHVDGMPEPELHEDKGHRFHVTEVVKRVGEPPLRTVHIRITGIPGPGPLRFIAVGIALLLIGVGVFITRAGGHWADAAAAARNLELEKTRLLERARELETERTRGDIGPEFHAQAQQELEEQLAAVLYEQARVTAGKPAGAKA